MANNNLTTFTPESWEPYQRYKEVLNQTAESANKAETSHKALAATLSALGKEVPELSSAFEGLSALAENGGAGAIVALTKAWDIYKQRVDDAAQAMSGLQMPDLTSGITQAKQLGEKWNGVADAVKKANDEFNSVEKQNERNQSADEKDHENKKKTIDLQKQQALANLDLQKGTMTKAQYEMNKAGIENYYTGKEAHEDQRFEQQKLQRKEDFQKKLAAQAKSEASQADGMKLPKTQEEFDAQIKALETQAKTLGDSSAMHQGNADNIRGVQRDMTDGFWGGLRAIPGAVGAQLKYGWGTKGGTIISEQEGMAKDARDQQTHVQQEISRRKKAWAEKMNLQQQAENDSGKATTLHDEIYSRGGDVDQFNSDTQTRQQFTQARQNIDMTRAIAQASEQGRNVQAAFDAFHQANLGNWTSFAQQLHKHAGELKTLKDQLHSNQGYGHH